MVRVRGPVHDRLLRTRPARANQHGARARLSNASHELGYTLTILPMPFSLSDSTMIAVDLSRCPWAPRAQSLTFIAIALSMLALHAMPPRCMAQDELYETHPDSVRQPGVPEGKVIGPFAWTSQIYPGTQRNYHLYIPSQYNPAQPACLFIVQDGLGRANEWKLPVVLDNLIADKSMPVTLGLFIEPGVVPAPNADSQPRFNRSFEYDGLGDRYARFLVEELIPQVKKDYNLSDDPNDRALAGASSGGICALNAAWERPDQFRRVLSTIGTFVGLRGADQLSTLIRKTEPKPLRVFLQDGDHDLNIYAGDWFIANLQMRSALEYSGYEVNHVWGQGGHNGKQGAAIMPDALRWLWKDHPTPIAKGLQKGARLNVVLPGEEWQIVSQGHQFTEGPAVDRDGNVFFVDVSSNQIFKVTDVTGDKPSVRVFATDTAGASGLMFGPDGKLYACQYNGKKIVRYDASGAMEVIVSDSPCNDLVVTMQGVYYTNPANKKVMFVTFDGVQSEVDAGIAAPNGLIVSPDQSVLHVADSDGRFTWSFAILPDGKLAHKQEYGHLHTTDASTRTQADGMSMDVNGNLYVTTSLGVQILDPLGRVNQILPKPQNAFLSNVAFGGSERNILIVTCGDKVYRRKVNARGSVSWEPPTKPPKPGL